VLSKDAAAALYNRSHLGSSANIAKEKLTISARICDMCSCAIEEQLTKVTVFEEMDEEVMLCISDQKKETADEDQDEEDGFVVVDDSSSSKNKAITCFII
jgi:hypothetical protein